MSSRRRTVVRNGMVIEERLDASGNVTSKQVLGRAGETEENQDFSILDWSKLLEGLGIDIVSEKKYGGEVRTRKASSSAEKN